MRKLQGKIALVTGQGGEISLATANYLVDEGAHVFLINDACPELPAPFYRQAELTCVRGDPSDVGELDRLLAQVERERGKLDIIFANAVADEYPSISEILKHPSESIINLDGTVACSAVQKALPLLRAGGSIILNAAPVAGARLSVDSLYCATKATVFLVAQIWTRQLEDRWIRVNVVSSGTSLGSAPTDGMEAIRRSSRSLPGSLPSGRPNTPSDVANAVVSLSCDDDHDLTGAELIVEGGTTRLRMLPTDPPPVSLTSPDEIARAVVFLASDDSKGITGMELFVDGGMAPL